MYRSLKIILLSVFLLYVPAIFAQDPPKDYEELQELMNEESWSYLERQLAREDILVAAQKDPTLYDKELIEHVSMDYVVDAAEEIDGIDLHDLIPFDDIDQLFTFIDDKTNSSIAMQYGFRSRRKPVHELNVTDLRIVKQKSDRAISEYMLTLYGKVNNGRERPISWFFYTMYPEATVLIDLVYTLPELRGHKFNEMLFRHFVINNPHIKIAEAELGMENYSELRRALCCDQLGVSVSSQDRGNIMQAVEKTPTGKINSRMGFKLTHIEMSARDNNVVSASWSKTGPDKKSKDLANVFALVREYAGSKDLFLKMVEEIASIYPGDFASLDDWDSFANDEVPNNGRPTPNEMSKELLAFTYYLLDNNDPNVVYLLNTKSLVNAKHYFQLLSYMKESIGIHDNRELFKFILKHYEDLVKNGKMGDIAEIWFKLLERHYFKNIRGIDPDLVQPHGAEVSAYGYEEKTLSSLYIKNVDLWPSTLGYVVGPKDIDKVIKLVNSPVYDQVSFIRDDFKQIKEEQEALALVDALMKSWVKKGCVLDDSDIELLFGSEDNKGLYDYLYGLVSNDNTTSLDDIRFFLIFAGALSNKYNKLTRDNVYLILDSYLSFGVIGPEFNNNLIIKKGLQKRPYINEPRYLELFKSGAELVKGYTKVK